MQEPDVRCYSYADSGKNVNMMAVDLDRYTTIYFSYESIVAFISLDTGWVVSENPAGVTTGKHINQIIANYDKKDRLPRDKFLQAFDEMMQTFACKVCQENKCE